MTRLARHLLAGMLAGVCCCALYWLTLLDHTSGCRIAVPRQWTGPPP